MRVNKNALSAKPQITTDSLFTSDATDFSAAEEWSDIQLIHESEKGWSVVYSGLYRGKRVAIKGLKPEYRESEFHQSLLCKEFDVTSAMNHQNIAGAICMADVPESGRAILLEYVDGVTLSDYLESNPDLTPGQIVDIIRQLCSAVGYIHSRQTVHCDLKPSNIMITRSGFVKVIDFGISRGNGFEILDFAGGTRGFTAPENFDSDGKVSVAVDIYSIGRILEQMDRKGRFKGVWKKCLSPDPENRPAGVRDILELIELSLARFRRRRSLCRRIGVALGVGICVIAGGFYLISKSSATPFDTLPFIMNQLPDSSNREMILKDLMLRVQNNVEISAEEKRMLDSISYNLRKEAYDCGDWLIDEALKGGWYKRGGIKGADSAQWDEYHLYHLCIWLEEEYVRLKSWVGVFLNRHAESGGMEVRFYVVCESQDESLHALLREKLDLLPGEKREGDYWWFVPQDENLQKLEFVSVADRQAIQSRVEQMLERLNAVACID